MERIFTCATCGMESENMFDFQFITGEDKFDFDEKLPFNTGQNHCNACAKNILSQVENKLEYHQFLEML
jgi:hypothetical protein